MARRTNIDKLFDRLLDACAEDELETVESLITKINPGSFDSKALTVACTWGNYEIVKLLLADSRVQPTLEAFIEACSEDHLKIVKLLVDDARLNCVECASEVLKFDEVKHNESMRNLLLPLIPLEILMEAMDIEDDC